MSTSPASSTFDQLGDGTTVLLDASIFLYHFTGVSAECRQLLADCERGRLRGVTSVVVVAEVSHRLMTIEAVMKGLVSPGNVVRKLREKPDIVRRLRLYREQVEQIPAMGVAIGSLDREDLALAADLRRRYGLLTNDSLVAATAISQGIFNLASGDRDFLPVHRLRVFLPSDL